MSATGEKRVELSRSEAQKIRTTASAIHGIEHMITSAVSTGIVPVAQSGQVKMHAHQSWGVVAVQQVGDPDHARATARAAGRRVVRKYGGALERLAD